MEFVESSDILDRKIIVEYLKTQFNTYRGDFNDGEKVYLKIARSYFQNALDGLNVVANNGTHEHWINQDARWFYEALTGEEIICGSPKEKIMKVIDEVEESKKRFEKFARNPEKSKKTGNTKQLESFVNKLWNSYAEKLYDLE